MNKRKAAPVLVTGGAGYIGSHTCKALAAAGYYPVSLDNLTLGHRWAVQWGPLVEADLLDADAVQRALREYRIEAVIHFAASAYVGDSMRDPAAYYRNNVLTTLALLDAMRSANVKDLIFSSSCSVYGNPRHVPIDETHPTGPLSPYGQSKLDGENALRWYGQASKCAGWRCGTLTPRVPMRRGTLAKIIVPRLVSCRARSWLLWGAHQR